MTEEGAAQEISRRCTMCGISFPNDPMWSKCAQCGGKTDLLGNAAATVDAAEALKLLHHREFEEYLEKEGKE